LAPAEAEVRDILGLEACYRDPNVARWGLTNVLFPLGTDFLEIVAPFQPGTSAGRYLARRGGNGGYMVIFQSADAREERARIAKLGVRFIHETDRPGPYHATQFHPKDLGNVLVSIESCGTVEDFRDPAGPWYPAGAAWQPHVRTERSARLRGVELQSEDPAGMARRWSEVLGVPFAPDGQGCPQLAFDNILVRFVTAADGRGAGVAGLDVEAVDRAAILKAAEARGLVRSDSQVEVCGVRIYLVPPGGR
jgi:hypothetical protein